MIGTASEVLPSDDTDVAAAAKTADDVGDVWSTEMQSPVMEDVDKAAPSSEVKRNSQEFHEDLLHIKPYVYCTDQQVLRTNHFLEVIRLPRSGLALPRLLLQHHVRPKLPSS